MKRPNLDELSFRIVFALPGRKHEIQFICMYVFVLECAYLYFVRCPAIYLDDKDDFCTYHYVHMCVGTKYVQNICRYLDTFSQQACRYVFRLILFSQRQYLSCIQLYKTNVKFPFFLNVEVDNGNRFGITKKSEKKLFCP